MEESQTTKIPTITHTIDLPHDLAAHVGFLAAAQGVSRDQAIIDLIREDQEAWQNDTKVRFPWRR